MRACSRSPDGSGARAGRVEIRAAREADLAQIAAIWNHEVLCTDATTDTEPRDEVAQREWLARHTEPYPVIVAVSAADGAVSAADVVAYGALSPYQPRPAFARTVEDSVYVERGRRGAGLGSLILSELIRRAGGLGHHSILARITAKNVASLPCTRATASTRSASSTSPRSSSAAGTTSPSCSAVSIEPRRLHRRSAS